MQGKAKYVEQTLQRTYEERSRKMVEVAVTDEKQEERERGMIRDFLVELRKRKDKEDEARNLIEEMQRDLDDAQNKSYEVEQKLNRILWEFLVRISTMAR